MMSRPCIYVIHENSTWVEPLRRAFYELHLPYEQWFLADGTVDLGAPPPEGVFYNRMSASSHTRDHRFAAELTGVVLAWLERYGRRVLNGSRALELEISKARQYTALHACGIRTPRTVAAVGEHRLTEAARAFATGPLILKPNRGGRGQGVQLFTSIESLLRHIAEGAVERPIDGVYLLQEYIRAPAPFITRAEFVGGRFMYAVRVNTSGGFELCPADVCTVDESCPADEASPKFQIIDGIGRAQITAYEKFLAANQIDIAGVEFITDGNGCAYTYDVNTNTNYNGEAEAAAGRSGMGEIARLLGQELQDRYPASANLARAAGVTAGASARL
jgi:hypothetical protein